LWDLGLPGRLRVRLGAARVVQVKLPAPESCCEIWLVVGRPPAALIIAAFAVKEGLEAWEDKADD
jgi:hypothetical protein